MKKCVSLDQSLDAPNNTHQDYYATPYAAEIVNTLTNLLFLYFGYLGVRSCQKYGHDSVFLVSFIGYLLVGAGSLAFHATLKCTPFLYDFALLWYFSETDQ